MLLTLTATEACERLKIRPATLYAYVSRGLIRSEAGPDPRSRRYLAEDVERLLLKKAMRREPDSVAESVLDWGVPVLASSVSRIYDGRLFYREQPLESLLDHSLEAITALLWGQDYLALPEASEKRAGLGLPAELGAYERLQLTLLWAGSQDLRAFDLRPEAIRASCGRILKSCFALVSGQARSPDLLGHFGALDPARRQLLRLMLIVCADHELNTSTFTARCVASARATPFAAVSAGLAALEGQRHGGSTRLCEALFRLCEQAPSVHTGLRQWLQQGEPMPGCGHKLYPQGDPRWRVIETVLRRDFADHPALALASSIADGFAALELPPPNLDFALVTASRVIAWPGAEPLLWFALGRSIGWLAHIQEQYGQELLIRPRARGDGKD